MLVPEDDINNLKEENEKLRKLIRLTASSILIDLLPIQSKLNNMVEFLKIEESKEKEDGV